MRWLEWDSKQDWHLKNSAWMYAACVLLLALSKKKKVKLGEEVYLYSGRKERFDRVISMCAALEFEDASVAGMKWVSSCAKNLSQGLPRGGAVSILNDGETGMPLLAYEGSAISLARTAMVACLSVRNILPWVTSMALIGAGRVHQWQAHYAKEFWPGVHLQVFDLNEERKEAFAKQFSAHPLGRWENGLGCDVVSLATAGAGSTGWIHNGNTTPAVGQVWVNTSLRDIQPSFVKQFPLVVVDDHGYAASQGTPYDFAWQAGWVRKEMSLVDLVIGEYKVPTSNFPVLVNPMGLPLWDVGIGYLLHREAFHEEKGKLGKFTFAAV
jgi:ornithine cyclodeaminase/alanine dehydrogenase-like protein (mu-crystallin family)